jgi:hypothetical protein
MHYVKGSRRTSRRTTRLHLAIERWPNLKREAEAKALHIFRNARIAMPISKIGYRIDADRNVIEMFVFVDPATAAQFDHGTLHRLTESGANHPEIRKNRVAVAQLLLQLGEELWNQVDIRLVHSWPEELDFYRDNLSGPLSEEELAALEARRPPAPRPKAQPPAPQA